MWRFMASSSLPLCPSSPWFYTSPPIAPLFLIFRPLFPSFDYARSSPSFSHFFPPPRTFLLLLSPCPISPLLPCLRRRPFFTDSTRFSLFVVLPFPNTLPSLFLSSPDPPLYPPAPPRPFSLPPPPLSHLFGRFYSIFALHLPPLRPALPPFFLPSSLPPLHPHTLP
ncbi:hypothetical protein C8J57DRAFT_1380004 [Mycena rebaudengoi]|nr:hypothetical protein C8J57DRAFT_1380004 [Mycena rebaudengoi]